MSTSDRQQLADRLEQLKTRLDYTVKKIRVTNLEQQVSASDFWSDPQEAGKLSQELKQNQDVITKIDGLSTMLGAAGDEEIAEVEAELATIEDLALLSGPHDSAPAIFTIHAGTGGTDAQDWAEMLLRLYLRLAERRGWKASLLDESRGEEAGIKKATLLIEGENTYGWLKGEAGVHRLVRLSPFNAKNLRQTSFALVDLLPEIEQTGLQINPDELRIDVFRASGHGGQSVNTTDSAVRITHLPTNIVVSVQNERSQLQNKATAMKILESKLVRLKEIESEEERAQIRGDIPQAAWGNQIRNYVLQPYTLVKDLRTGVETADTTAVLNGEIDQFLDAELRLPQP